MRLFLFLILLVAAPILAKAQLAALPADAALSDFEAQLESYMTDSRNTRARDAYANFTGVFLGGGLDEAQQRRVIRSAIGLAAIKSAPDNGMASYLDLHEFLQGKDKQSQQLFDEFHTMLEAAPQRARRIGCPP